MGPQAKPLHGGFGSPEEESLAEFDVELAKHLQLSVTLDALGDETAARRPAEVTQAGDQGLAGGVDVEAGDPRPVELHELRLELEDVAEAGESGAGIVD